MDIYPILAANSGVVAGLQKTGAEIGHKFGFDTQLFVSQLISFLIVAFLLHKFAYKPILRLLEQRRTEIAQSLENAEKIKAELAKAQVTAQEIVNQANANGNKLIEEARTAAARVLETETQKAIVQAEQIIAKAREASAADHARMLAELKAEVGRLVVETTAKVSGKVLTMDDQKRLAEETSKQLAA